MSGAEWCAKTWHLFMQLFLEFFMATIHFLQYLRSGADKQWDIKISPLLFCLSAVNVWQVFDPKQPQAKL